MNVLGKLILVFFIFGFVPGISPAQEEEGEFSVFNWKMAVLKKNVAAYESVPFRQPLSMTRRDMYQLYLGFESSCLCYVIQENDEGRLPLIYKKAVSSGDKIILPGEGGDFKAAENPGTSRFYIVVSARPKQNLERLINQYIEQQGKEPAPAALERSILSEALAIRRSVSSRPEPPEKTAPAAGTDPSIKGDFWLFESRDDWVVTVTVRVQ